MSATSAKISDDCIVWFAIPLASRQAMPEWERVEQLFNSTLASIFNQTDPHFRVVVVCTEKPRLSKVYDERLAFVYGPSSPVRSWRNAIEDAGRKRLAAANAIAKAGGGYVMFVDADDLISNRIVAHVRATRNPNGYIVKRGYGLNLETGSLATIPFSVNDMDFSRICGTSLILFLSPEDVLAGSPSRYSRLMNNGHVGVLEVLDAEQRPPKVFDFPSVCYVLNTGVKSASKRAGNENSDRAKYTRYITDGIEKHRIPVSRQIATEFALNKKPLLPIELQQATSLTVAISTFKRPQGLHRLLTALEPQIVGRSERKVVVINDGSHNSAYEVVAAEFDHMIQYHPLPSNIGIAAARNESVKRADSEYVVFTDDDCLPPPYWLDWLAARLIASPDLDVIAGSVRPLMPKKPSFFAGVQARHHIFPFSEKTVGGLRFVTANLAIRRKFFWDIGGFRVAENFPGAGEDTELSVRVSRSDCRRCLDHDWFVGHDVGDGFFTNVRRFHRYGYVNMLSTFTTALLWEHNSLRFHTKHRRLKNFIEQYRRQLPAARAASKWRLFQWLSALLASFIFVAYFHGVTQASIERKRNTSV